MSRPIWVSPMSAWWRRWPQPRQDWTASPWRWPWRGRGTPRASQPRSWGARTPSQLRGALASEDLVLPVQIRHALDEITAVKMGYPERF